MIVGVVIVAIVAVVVVVVVVLVVVFVYVVGWQYDRRHLHVQLPYTPRNGELIHNLHHRRTTLCALEAGAT